MSQTRFFLTASLAVRISLPINGTCPRKSKQFKVPQSKLVITRIFHVLPCHVEEEPMDLNNVLHDKQSLFVQSKSNVQMDYLIPHHSQHRARRRIAQQGATIISTDDAILIHN